jgi:hypothetical protein
MRFKMVRRTRVALLAVLVIAVAGVISAGGATAGTTASQVGNFS